MATDDELIEASSLGTPGARSLRARAAESDVSDVLHRARLFAQEQTSLSENLSQGEVSAGSVAASTHDSPSPQQRGREIEQVPTIQMLGSRTASTTETRLVAEPSTLATSALSGSFNSPPDRGAYSTWATSSRDGAGHDVIQRYPLEPGLWLVLTPEGDTWRCTVESSAPYRSTEPQLGADALAHLLRYQQVPPVEGFDLVRHVPAPEASGERPMDDDGRVVVVGERVVVSWNRVVRDIPYTAPATLAQLAAVNFLGVPDTHGLLLWSTPSGHQAPIAIVTRYLPRALDGRQALATLLRRGPTVESQQMPSLAARMGRITAALHVALATRSKVLPEPVRAARPDELRAWHRRVRATLERAALIAAEGTAPGVARGYLTALHRYEAEAEALDRAAVEREVLVQRVHGDLHVGRILRWAGGLIITGFGDEPDADPLTLGPQPPVRDLARLLQSLTGVARLVDDEIGDDWGTTEWLPDARRRLLAAYRTELDVAGRTELLDERLLAAFEAEHAACEVIAAMRRLLPQGDWASGDQRNPAARARSGL